MTTGERFARTCVVLVLACCAAIALPTRAAAQYFGRNKVQYQTFSFRTMHTDHFDIYFYPAESVATADAARMAERWYLRYRELLQQEFPRKPIVLYANHADFQQTNIIGGFIDQGTGGVTEPLRDRVVMPLTGVYAENNHVLGHELVHVFQFDIAGTGTGRGYTGLGQLPLWLIEGMAEYLSIGTYDPNTAMWLRDAALRNDLPTIKQLSTDSRYFPYRYGEALWAYIGGVWGDGTIKTLYRNAINMGWEPAVRRVLGVSSDSLSKLWLASIRQTYLPVMQGRQAPDSLGKRMLNRTGKYGDFDVSPALSPDGKYVSFFTQRGLLNIDLYVADASTGRIVKKLTSPNTAGHFEALSFINSAGSWSPDEKRLAYVVYKGGDNAIAIWNVETGNLEREIRVKGVGAILDPAWGPNDRIAFAGNHGGISDLYVIDLATEKVEQLTNDKFAVIQPTWSPDGKTITFASDRGPNTSFDVLAFGPMNLASYDLATGNIQIMSPFPGAKHINPQYSPDGRSLYFVSDRGGFDDIYRMDLASGDVYQVTRAATGISGITYLSPALTVASRSGALAFSVFDHGGYSLFRVESGQAQGGPLVQVAAGPRPVAGSLPPIDRERPVVDAYLANAENGLPPSNTEYAVTPYRPSLGLEYLGSPTVGIGYSSFYGTQVGGGISAYFADMLSNNILGVAVSGSGNVKYIGGQVVYQNLAHRWNYGAAVSYLPYLLGGFAQNDTTIDGQPAAYIEQQIFRQNFLQAALFTQYPFSQTYRLELQGGYTHVGFGIDFDRIYFDPATGIPFAEQTGSRGAGPGIGYFQGSAALVGDYSYFGFTSPIAGGRWRLEVDPTVGDLKYTGTLADYRRYLFVRPITLAARGMFYGRFGKGGEDPRLQLAYIGDPQLVRGYDVQSLSAQECTLTPSDTLTACPEISRLLGSRIAVANVELRIPLFGTDQLGLINFPYLPTEIAPFFDAGLAWTAESGFPTIKFAQNTLERVPVFSTGVAARVNILGYLVAQFYYAKPFERKDNHWRWGFLIAPGW